MDLLSQHEAFLRAIFDAPDDDTPRLIYADFLQENGDEDRAELIRVQCELALKHGRADHFDRLWALETRQSELIWRLEPELAYLEPWQRKQSGYERGFRPAGGTFIVASAALAAPLAERGRIVRREPEQFGARNLAVEAGLMLRPEHIESLFTLPVVQRVSEWLLNGFVSEALSHSGPGAFDLIELTQQPAITTPAVEALAQHKGVRRITSLDLRNNNLDNDAARALVKSPYLDNLKRLRLLEGNRFRGKVWQQVVERFGEDVLGGWDEDDIPF
jgi:uncharacterized protein (TIGR02996 family)